MKLHEISVEEGFEEISNLRCFMKLEPEIVDFTVTHNPLRVAEFRLKVTMAENSKQQY